MAWPGHNPAVRRPKYAVDDVPIGAPDPEGSVAKPPVRVRARERPRAVKERVESLVQQRRFDRDAPRFRSRPMQIGAVAVSIVGIGLWWSHGRLQSDATPRVAPAPLTALPTLPLVTAVGSRSTSKGSDPQAVAPEGSVVSVPATMAVHAAGSVVRPGVYELPVGSRVDDVIAAAGGLDVGADPNAINLAALVVDAERVFVPKVGEAIPPIQTGGSSGVGGSASTASGPVDLNRATAEELDALPGVGPTTAAAIVEHRRLNGPFGSVDQLLEVTGIGPSKLAALRTRVRI